MNPVVIMVAVLMLVLVDILTPFLPISALLLAIVAVARPKWFKQVVDDLYRPAC